MEHGQGGCCLPWTRRGRESSECAAGTCDQANYLQQQEAVHGETDYQDCDLPKTDLQTVSTAGSRRVAKLMKDWTFMVGRMFGRMAP